MLLHAAELNGERLGPLFGVGARESGAYRLGRLAIGGETTAGDGIESEELVRGEGVPPRVEVRQAVFSKVAAKLRSDFCREGFSTSNKIIEWELNREVQFTARQQFTVSRVSKGHHLTPLARRVEDAPNALNAFWVCVVAAKLRG